MLDSFYANVGALKFFSVLIGGLMRIIRALQKANAAPTHAECKAHICL